MSFLIILGKNEPNGFCLKFCKWLVQLLDGEITDASTVKLTLVFWEGFVLHEEGAKCTQHSIHQGIGMIVDRFTRIF